MYIFTFFLPNFEPVKNIQPQFVLPNYLQNFRKTESYPHHQTSSEKPKGKENLHEIFSIKENILKDI